MRKNLRFVSLGLVVSLLFSSFGFAQLDVKRFNASAKKMDATQLTSVKSDVPSTFNQTKDEDGEWIHWDSGENTNGIGTNSAADFHIASRWEPADIADYNGMQIEKISFFPRHADCVYTVKIWVGADATEVYSQEVTNVTINEWNIAELATPYAIDASAELWFGVNINTQGGHPAGCDAGPQVGGKGNMIYFNGEWAQLTDLNAALTYNWNIQAYVAEGSVVEYYDVTFTVADEDGAAITNAVITLGSATNAAGEYAFADVAAGTYTYSVVAAGYVTATGEVVVAEDVTVPVVLVVEQEPEYAVTFIVDLNNVEGFDHESDEVFVAIGDQMIEMALMEQKAGKKLNSKDNPPFTFFESFEDFDDFTTDLSPWTTYQITTGNTYSSNNFDFPGEGTAFAFMVFNPNETTPPIVETHPAVDGNKYAVAVQYTSLNDDKWLITPELSFNETSALSFWGKSITDAYGLERIAVLVSTTGTEVSDFTKISSGDYFEVPIEWTEFTFDLSAFAGETGYIAINYKSYDAFFFMLDKFEVTAEVEEPETYTVTFNVKDVDGNAINDAVVTLGGVTNAAGVYVFEEVEAGTYDFTVVAEGYVNVSDQVTVVDADVEVNVTMEEGETPVQLFYVATVMLTAGDYEYMYYINDETDNILRTVTVVDEDVTVEDVYGASNLSSDAYILSFAFEGVDANVVIGANTITVTVAIGTNIESLTPTITISEFAIISPAPVDGVYGPMDFTSPVEFTVTAEDGTVNVYTVTVAEEQAGFNVTFNVNMAGFDFNPETDVIYITGSMFGWATPGDQPEKQTMTRVDDSMIWTVTMSLEAGSYEYKYFKNAGWDGGEWAGGDNRTVVVEGDMIVNDTWGVLNANFDLLSNINIYPNPFRNQITIANAEYVNRVVITNLIGQVLVDMPVNSNQQVINTSNLNNGVYLVTLFGENGERAVRKVVKQ